jgi:hypothetical protein
LLGQVVATPGALEALRDSGRHAAGHLQSAARVRHTGGG